FGHLLHPNWIRRSGSDDSVLQLFPAAVVNTVLEHTMAYDPTTRGGSPPAEPRAAPTQVGDLGQPGEQPGQGYGERWKYDPNGNLAEYQDRDGSVYRYTYKAWNVVEKVIDPLGNATTYEVSPNQRFTRLTDPGGTVHEFLYDQKDRLV